MILGGNKSSVKEQLHLFLSKLTLEFYYSDINVYTR